MTVKTYTFSVTPYLPFRLFLNPIDMFHYLSMSNRSSSSPVTTGLLSGLNGVPQLFPLVFRLAVTLPGPTGGRTAVTLVYCARDASDSKPATT